ncbi:MAG: chorismate-binding protein, partial [Acidobacteria bacterium]|nr:chorismate-binding protein [Acidobacteriota bacterium]
VTGSLRDDAAFSDVIKAVFPCGSVTGAPKHRTMQIIDELEKSNRGLSMGAIGVFIPERFGLGKEVIDVNVAIRTMVIRDGEAVFNVGGGITIDSNAEAEYEETVTKSKALLTALGVRRA